MNETLRIGFRVDAGDTVGTGHVMEIISLVKQLRRSLVFEPVVLTARNDFAIDKFREIEVKNIISITAGAPEEAELADILAVLGEQGIRHLVVDLINRSDTYYGRLHEKLASTCVILDSDEHKELAATVVVNFSVTQDPAWYQTAHTYETKYLIGPRYFLWDEAIKGTRRHDLRPEVGTVLINQGGSDPFGLTVKILQIVEQENLPQKFWFVLGGHMQKRHRAELERLRNSLKSNSEFFSDLTRQAFYRLMQGSDMAISAAGNTLYELLYIGVPTIVISHHRLHDQVAKAFERKGAVLNLGIGAELYAGRMTTALKRLIADYPGRQGLRRHAQNLFANDHGPTLIDELVKLYR